MIIKPIKTIRIKGLTYNICKSVSAPPTNATTVAEIQIFKMPQLPLKIKDQAEYYVRQTYQNQMRNFLMNYYIDKYAVWKILEGPQRDNRKNVIKIGVCGESDKLQLNLIKLLTYLIKEFKLGLNLIFYKANFSQDFQQRIADGLVIEEVPLYVEEYQEPIIAPVIIPELTYQLYSNGQLKSCSGRAKIDQLRICITQGQLSYRIHWYKGKWSNWVNNGELIGTKGLAIDCIQYEFELEGYKLYHSISSGTNTTSLRATSYKMPLGKPLDNIEFKLIKD